MSFGCEEGDFVEMRNLTLMTMPTGAEVPLKRRFQAGRRERKMTKGKVIECDRPSLAVLREPRLDILPSDIKEDWHQIATYGTGT